MSRSQLSDPARAAGSGVSTWRFPGRPVPSSRLTANIPFDPHNLAPLSFVDVPHDLYIEGILGVYEPNRVELLRDIFESYERPCQRYTVLRDALPTPDPLRLRHRETVRMLVADIVAATCVATMQPESGNA